MSDFPISITEASKRLEIPKSTASILVKTHRIGCLTNSINPNAKLLDASAFEQLAAYAADFKPVKVAS